MLINRCLTYHITAAKSAFQCVIGRVSGFYINNYCAITDIRDLLWFGKFIQICNMCFA